MADFLSSLARSRRMGQVRQQGTTAELLVREIVTDLGLRYRVNFRDLPGSPDLAFPKRRRVVFVHGCFWHGHRCRQGQEPSSRREYWVPKLEENRRRDRRALRALRNMGWRTLVVWQCQLKNRSALARRLARFLETSVQSTSESSGT
jgi:DNA mismatch endonuclease (patch repair protein)